MIKLPNKVVQLMQMDIKVNNMSNYCIIRHMSTRRIPLKKNLLNVKQIKTHIAPVGRTTQTSFRAASDAAKAEATKPRYRVVNPFAGNEDERMESQERAVRRDQEELERARQLLSRRETQKERELAQAEIQWQRDIATQKRLETIARKKREEEEKEAYIAAEPARLRAKWETEEQKFLLEHPLISKLTWCVFEQKKTPNIRSEIYESMTRIDPSNGKRHGKCWYMQ